MQGWLSPTGWKIGLGCAVFTLCLWALGNPLLQDIELKVVDARFRLRGVRPVSNSVVIAAIDQRSIDALGRWPWPRSEVARLITSLSDLGARVVALDMVFSEPDRDNPANDRLLAESIRSAGNVVLGYQFRFGRESVFGGREDYGLKVSEEEAARAEKRRSEALEVVSVSRIPTSRKITQPRVSIPCGEVEPNIPGVNEASGAMGHISLQPDLDGVVRRVPALVPCGDDYYTSLSLRTVMESVGNLPLMLDLEKDKIRALSLGGRRLWVDEQGSLRVNFPGPVGSFPYYSAIDLIRGRVPEDAVRDRIVIVGTTELGIENIRATPFGPVVPGVEIQAAAVETLLNGPFILRNNNIIMMDILIVLIIGVGLGGLFHRLPQAVQRAETFLGAVIFFMGWDYLAFGKLGMQLNAFYPAMCLVLTYLVVSLDEAFGVERRVRETRKAFETYVGPAVVESIVRSPERLALGGVRRDITVAFSDIEGFTTISEALAPEEVVRLLNAYLTPMTDLVFRHGGTLDKYIGDAVMAMYGAPIELPDHADRACRTALGMMGALAKLKNKEWYERGWPDIRIRIGMSSGPMAVGNMGSAIRFHYTVIGDGVNLASRVEKLNKIYGTGILLSELTRERLRSPFILREIDLVRVRGRRKPVRIYELRGEGTPTREETALIRGFEQGLEAFRQRHWMKARERFQACLEVVPDDGPARLFLSRCDLFERDDPGPEWDGMTDAPE